MQNYLKQWAALALLFVLAGCSSHGRDLGVAAESATAAPSAPVQGKASGRLLVWTADFSLQVPDMSKARNQLSERMLALGGYVEEKSDYG